MLGAGAECCETAFTLADAVSEPGDTKDEDAVAVGNAADGANAAAAGDGSCDDAGVCNATAAIDAAAAVFAAVSDAADGGGATVATVGADGIDIAVVAVGDAPTESASSPCGIGSAVPKSS